MSKSDSRRVVTRFAPSPTGFLHIGGARTALFNYLYARARGGEFHLRIEDTDRARHNEAAVAAIVDGLTWLGLDWDGEPVSQYAQAPRHAEAARALLDAGKAYRCYLTPEETADLRDRAKADGVRFTSPWRDRDPAEAPADTPFVVRFKAPLEGRTLARDRVQGDVSFDNAALDDLVLLRSDGSPTYMLAVVVDDHDMGVTHVIRGDDHFVNAVRQIQIYEALGWDAPMFAHVPLIHGPDGAKLSKRHGALGVDAYRDMGYLPEALCNYLLRLGWSHGDDEIIDREQALEWFDLDSIGKAPARLDFDKLARLNQHYLRIAQPERLIDLMGGTCGETLEGEAAARVRRAMPFLTDRSKTVLELVENSGYLTAERPLSISGKAEKPLRKEGAREILRDLAGELDSLGEWTAAAIDAKLQAFVEAKGVSFGAVGPPVRAALTAGAPAPGLGDLMEILGKEESLGRLSDQIQPVN